MNGSAGDLSRADRAWLLALTGILAVAVSASPIRSYDYWWHLATGRLIAAEGAVPRADPFSFTAAGTPWVDHEWLAQVLMYAGHTVAGPVGLQLFKIAVVAALALLMTARLRRQGIGPAASAALMTTALLGAAFRFDLRPEIATLLLVPLALELVLRARETGALRPLLAVPCLVALGANLHPGILLVPALLAAGTMFTWVATRLPAALSPDAARQGGARFTRRLLATTGAAAAATAVNPYGFALARVPFEISAVLASIPSPNLEWARPSPHDFPLFWAAAVAAPLVLLARPRRCDPIAASALLLAEGLALLHLRNIGIFCVLLPWGLAGPLRDLADAASRRLERITAGRGVQRPGFIAASVILGCAAPAVAVLPPAAVWGVGMASGNEPAAAVDFLERENVGRRLYNDVRFGGYLIWRRAPAHPVFVDGRNEVYPHLLRQVFAAVGDSRAWEAFLDDRGIDAAFLRYNPALERVTRPGVDGRPPVVVERAFSANHFPRERWALVYWDDDVMLVLRRTPENAAAIARHEYAAVQPEDWRYLYAAVLTGHQSVGPVIADLDRKLAEDPACRLAAGLRARFEPLRRAAADRAAEAARGR